MSGLQHHRDGNLAHARRIGHGRPGHARKDQADQNVHLRQSTLEPAHHRLAEIQQPVADCACVHDVGSNNEQRHRQQHKAVIDRLDQLFRRQRQILTRSGQIGHSRNNHRKGNRHSQGGRNAQYHQTKQKFKAHRPTSVSMMS
jgi:hypothetical protein